MRSEALKVAGLGVCRGSGRSSSVEARRPPNFETICRANVLERTKNE